MSVDACVRACVVSFVLIPNVMVCVCTCSKKWAAAPVGAADPGKTEWTPQQNVPIANSEKHYGCQCMKGCTCYKETCFCASLDTIPVPQKPGYDQWVALFGTDGAILKSASDGVQFKNGKILLNGSKMTSCRCMPGGYCVVPVRGCAPSHVCACARLQPEG